MSSSRPAHLRAAAALAALGLLSLTACGQETAYSAPAKAAATANATSTASSKAAADSAPAVKVSRPADPLAPTTYKPVIRGGKAAHPSLTAAAVSFTQRAAYSDGVALRVTSIKHGAVSGQGPGVLSGQTTSSLTVTLTNGSKLALDLNQVVVTADYGRPARLASPIYDEGARDFSGTVAAGKSATAVYVFAIPSSQRSDVTVNVDFDGSHHAATFTGSVK
jgi:hypothetical protein